MMIEETYICSDSSHLNPLWDLIPSLHHLDTALIFSCFQAAGWSPGATTCPQRGAPSSATPSWGPGPGGSPGTGCSSTPASTGAPTSPPTGSSRWVSCTWQGLRVCDIRVEPFYNLLAASFETLYGRGRTKTKILSITGTCRTVKIVFSHSIWVKWMHFMLCLAMLLCFNFITK